MLTRSGAVRHVKTLYKPVAHAAVAELAIHVLRKSNDCKDELGDVEEIMSAFCCNTRPLGYRTLRMRLIIPAIPATCFMYINNRTRNNESVFQSF